MNKKIHIVLADDHQIFRDGIKALLSDIDDFKVVAEASNGDELLRMLETSEPDIIIMDISMPGISGIELTRKISELYPQIAVLILSMHSNEDFVINSVINGAKGYLPKDTGRKELLEAIYDIADGDEYFGKLITSNMMKSFIKKTQKKFLPVDKENQLTSREIEIIQQIGKGLSNKEIADKLFISVRTVDSHKNHMMQKLKLRSTAEIIIYAIKNKIIEIE
ncbi:MAG: response regulator transcription factor [Bacteroidales bacterium]|nr:response regulator transcription factor [Bacteroidales bacterium]